jgi:radical SAM protein with 4Fe4S-binding SPASM domain
MFNLKSFFDNCLINKSIKQYIKKQIKKKYKEFNSIQQISKTPTAITLEISSICNLNCEMCGSQNSTRPKKQMDWDIFTKSVDQLHDMGINWVRTYTINEPFVNDNIIEILEYLDKKGMTAYFSTNGTLVHKFIEKVKDTNLKNFEIKFSIDAATKETYEKIRKGAKFEKVIENLKLVNEYKQKYYNDLKIGLVYLVSSDTLAEIPAFIENFAKYFNKECMVFALLTEHNLGKENKFRESRLNYKVYPNIPCVNLKANNLAIHNNGDFSICCADYNGEMVFGNIKEQSIKEAWNNGKIIQLREANFNHDLASLPKPCKACKLSAQFHGFIINKIIELGLNRKIAIENIPYYIKKFIEKYDKKITSIYGLPR